MKKKTSLASKIYIAIIFIFLYAPIAIMMLFSMNSTSSTYIFSGFSTHWYQEMFKDTVAMQALKTQFCLLYALLWFQLFWAYLQASDFSIQNQNYIKML